MDDISRRNLLVIAGATACACCLTQSDAARADGPRRHHDDDDDDKRGPKGPTAKSLVIGTLTDYPKPGFYDKFRSQKVMVSRLDDRLVAMSAICTHKGCTVKVDPKETTQLLCPCHHAEYSDQGTPIKGPAKISLVRYGLTQAADGQITADLTKTFAERQWDDPAAMIPLPK